MDRERAVAAGCKDPLDSAGRDVGIRGNPRHCQNQKVPFLLEEVPLVKIDADRILRNFVAVYFVI